MEDLLDSSGTRSLIPRRRPGTDQLSGGHAVAPASTVPDVAPRYDDATHMTETPRRTPPRARRAVGRRGQAGSRRGVAPRDIGQDDDGGVSHGAARRPKPVPSSLPSLDNRLTSEELSRREAVADDFFRKHKMAPRQRQNDVFTRGQHPRDGTHQGPALTAKEREILEAAHRWRPSETDIAEWQIADSKAASGCRIIDPAKCDVPWDPFRDKKPAFEGGPSWGEKVKSFACRSAGRGRERIDGVAALFKAEMGAAAAWKGDPSKVPNYLAITADPRDEARAKVVGVQGQVWDEGWSSFGVDRDTDTDTADGRNDYDAFEGQGVSADDDTGTVPDDAKDDDEDDDDEGEYEYESEGSEVVQEGNSRSVASSAGDHEDTKSVLLRRRYATRLPGDWDGAGEAMDISEGWEDMTVRELRDHCRERGLKVSGLKDELVQRLRRGSSNE